MLSKGKHKPGAKSRYRIKHLFSGELSLDRIVGIHFNADENKAYPNLKI